MSRGIAIGICVGLDRAAQVAPGYDHLELPVTSTLIPLEDDAAFAQRAKELRRLQPQVGAFNVFAPAQLKLVGPNVDWSAIESYVQRALARAGEMGARVVVVGSGGARAVPEGFSRVEAWHQLVHFFTLCARYAAQAGITIAIEPLNHRECNILNSYPEGVRMARDVDRAEVRVLADVYHFMVESESFDDIIEDPEWLAHVHVADTGRLYPGSGSWPLHRLFDILQEVGYMGMVSVECSWGDQFTAETGKALQFLRAQLEQ
jgi:sugar phosphate isomerase/epimerase